MTKMPLNALNHVPYVKSALPVFKQKHFLNLQSLRSFWKMLNPEEISNRLSLIIGGFKDPSDEMFKNNKYFPNFVKKGVISIEEEDDCHQRNQIFCNVPGCERFFDSVFAYQSHYNSLHRYICSQCKKSLPTPHLLDLHLSENHDSYFSVVSKSKPMYSCFIEECQHKSNTADERKDHCITAHKFPMNFRFENFCLINKKCSPPDQLIDDPMDSKKSSGTKLNSQFTFGHAKNKTFNKKSYAKLLTKSDVEYKNTLEDSKMVTDLLNSLPE